MIQRVTRRKGEQQVSFGKSPNPNTLIPTVIVPFLFFVLLLTGCGRDLGTAQGVVEEFVDQHYVHFDLHKARTYVVSLALDKVNEEIRLTAGHKIDAGTRKPKINYRL